MGRTVSVKLMADVANFTRNIGGAAVGATKSLTAELGRAGVAVKTMAGELDRAAQAGKLDTVARHAAVMGVALSGAFGYAIKAAADFDKAMSGVSAATHAGAADMSALRGAALQAGKDTSYSATEAASAITELSKAGVKTADVLKGGLSGALSLAAAGQMDVGEAAEIAASAMTQFKLSGDKVGHVADLLAAGAGKAQGSVHDLGYAMSAGGLVAAQFGLGVEDTVGALAEFASAGLMGSDAGTSLKSMFIALTKPSEDTQKQMDKLGISFYDAQGNFVGLSGMAAILQDRLKGLTQEQRTQTLSMIFGSDAIRAASILYTDGAKGVEDWKRKVNDSGYAALTAAKQTDNLAGDVERLKGSLETMAIEAGTGANNGLRSLVKTANAGIDAFSALPESIQQTVTMMAGVGGASLLAIAGFIKARGTVTDFLKELREMGPTGSKAASALGSLGGVAGRLTLVGAAVGGVWVGLQAFGNWVDKKHAPVKANIDDLTESLKQFAATGQATGELASKYGTSLQRIGQDVAGVTDGMRQLEDARQQISQGLMDPSVTQNWNPVDPQSVQRIKDLDTALAALVNGGGAAQAKIALQNLQHSSGMTADRYRQLIAMLPSYTAATGAATQANTGVAKGFGTAASNATTMTSALKDAVDAGQKLTDVWLQLNGAVVGSDKAMLDANKSLTDVKQSFKENKRAIDGNSDAALRNRVAVGEAAKAAAAAAQAKFEETGSVSKASAVYNGYISQLRKTLHQAGLTDKQINTLIGTYAKMPDSVETKVSVVNNKPVEAKLNELLVKQYQLASGMSPSAAKASAQKDADRNRQSAYDTGGWTGPGAKHDVAGVVHADEFVVQKSARGSLEQQKPGALDYMNQTGRWPGYAGGGQVWPFPVDVSKTKIPKPPALGGAAGPGGGATDDWIVRTVMAHFPALNYISKFRKGAMTLTGNRSYHSMHRAVDWPANYELALWWHNTFGGRTKELITPWNELNIHNGQPHRYTGAVWNQHNFAGGNAHDHIAMAGGGVIREPVVGVGRSGRTYSFGEAGPETVTPGYASGGLVNVAPRAAAIAPTRGSRLDTADALLSAASAVAQLSAALKENGRSWSQATQKGRDNRSALISGVRAAQSAAKAKFDETGSLKAANQVYDDYIHKLDESMKKMHVNAKTRHDLIKAYGERPKYDLPDAPARAPSNSVGRVGMVTDQIAVENALVDAQSAFSWTKPTFSVGSATGRSELQQLFSFLSAAQAAAQSSFDYNGNAAGATSYYNGYLAQLRTVLRKSGLSDKRIDELFGAYGRITLTPKANRWGGVYEHAASGSLRDAQIAAGGPTQYAWAESSTGGEAFIPKYGNRQKSLAAWQYVGTQWLGQSVGQGGTRHITVDAPITFQIGTEAITRHVRFEVDAQLGQVATTVIHQAV